MLLDTPHLSIPQIPSRELLEDWERYPEGDLDIRMLVKSPRRYDQLFDGDMDDIASAFLPKELKS
tara:strand:+ start:388 stop:582 length:195 start_codon:yes stop_codon:yes gene_type:complete